MPSSQSTGPFVFTLDRNLKTPLFLQLCESVRRGVQSGQLRAGSLLPATRVLAQELGLSRSTVISAYDQLVAEGYMQGRQGAGYSICDIGNIELNDTGFDVHEARPVTQPAHTSGSPSENGLRAFTPSQPDMRLFPYAQWGRTLARVCRQQPESLLNCSDCFGNLQLRQAIADYMQQWRGLKATAAQVIVTAGATDALNLCFQTLADATRPVAIEDPGYPPLQRLIRSQGLTPAYLQLDQQGACVPPEDESPGLVVLTPSHQYPLGGVMPVARRREFMRWARAGNRWIIEDDYDSEFRYAGQPVPALAGLEGLQRTIYIGSFSKIFSNTLRLGYIIAPVSLLDAIRQTMNQTGVKAGILPQQALADFIQNGNLYRYLRKVRKVYAARQRFLTEVLSRDFSQFGRVEQHPAGMQLVFHLYPQWQDTQVAEVARAKGVALEPLSATCFSHSGHNGLIMGFCGFSETEMQQSLKVLAVVLKTMQPPMKAQQ